ncbi:penicillin-binding protein 1A [Mesorhizobium sp. M4B.F.Ca.ET.215.01.1.1]|uniref:transglycosylase domain-containing protein n=1 Tax=unclassified Mesorhizobium TaxID=325217 RepID=UPI000FCBEC19|nr:MULTISPECIES: penicillin-binding protein 1A [unclassified Mesorhizobium]RVD46041.1 penicillin-binding protein 1A [Mesorhizobium sp. M4B.F.Ca.ET.019.03.1.1]RWF66404.1 MAG: penicillin-binding protein 1A [Mesorhizobium sp.]TGQ13249.1 penicillin-binding protein 1A [Mesorhizobium sp. M4B.F.Ca.ET.215.01.1.1]TGQ43563.1 penicillin-binding protein 1A [Mesorhizobium sp. M4B.F.Ca.ET.214.01.1.1]TGQ46133.1 penicillin-binding protein 1A [Mesorhizobium sp. M00.F.Ca.ET.220.01.1.1]
MASPLRPRKRRGRIASALLAIDAWLDSSLYEIGFKAREFWESATIFSRRFRVKGWRRGIIEVLSEGFTMGAGGVVVLLALAMPAFQITDGDWRAQGDFAVTFLDRYGNEIGQRGIIQRDSVPVDEMPDHVIKAVLATEDRRFFDHYGIDVLGLSRAIFENVRANSVVQGGSSITQQLAKNLFLTNERTLERKIKEAFLSLWLEANLSKKEILQLYLDRAYMGGGTFGIEAAADFYFGKSVKDLNLAEAAMLAGLFKAPTKYAPHINLPAARARANVVLSNLVDSGFMTEGQVLQARLHPADVVDRGEQKSPDYFLDWAFDEVKKIAKPGQHSLVAHTTFDANIQKAAEESVEFHLRQFGKEYNVTEGAVVVIETNGAVRAIVGGRDYGASQFNRATKALRQTGSSFKPYVYATAMEHGFTPDSVVSGGAISWGGWSPHNYNGGSAGNVTLITAIAKSINTVPVRLAKDHLGIGPIKAMAESMGVESPLEGHKTMVLGTSGMTVMDQATGYSVFAQNGLVGSRHGITQLVTRTGDVVYDWAKDAPPPHRVLSEQALKYMNTMLAAVPVIGTARRAQLPNIVVAGKTGTTQSYRDAWFVGFTGNYTAAVWLGNDDFTPTNKMTGGTLPAMVWQRLMVYAHQNIDLKPIPGLDHPFVDPEVAAKAEEAAKKNVEAAEAQAAAERPPVLSSQTTQMLREMTKAFQTAPVLDAPKAPETLSAL